MKRRYVTIFLLFAIVYACRPVSPGYPRAGVYHTVKRHQTFWRICKTYGVDINEIARINHIRDPSRIRVGQKIFIPDAKRVLEVDIYIDDIGGKRGRPEDLKKIASVKGQFIWPVRGKVTKEFGIRGMVKHAGIDISAPMGTPIRASNYGKVLYSGKEIKGFGNIIIIKHNQGFITIYAHNEINYVADGEKIERGQIIGRVGNTGRTGGSYLYFEIRKNNRPINPRLLLN